MRFRSASLHVSNTLRATGIRTPFLPTLRERKTWWALAAALFLETTPHLLQKMGPFTFLNPRQAWRNVPRSCAPGIRQRFGMHQRYRVLALGLQALIFLALGQGSRPVEAHVGAEAPLAPACPLGGPLGLLPPGPGCGQPKLPPACPDDPPVPVVTLKVRVPAQAKIGNDIEYRICLEN